MIVVLGFLFIGGAYGKIYGRCELARELKFIHNAPNHQLATWVCIAEHESQYNTSIVGHKNGDGSGDHGIFQISDKYWCSPPGKGYACGLTCAELEDDDITDDFQCAQRIYKEHKTLSGDGFNAWEVYKPLCKGPKAERYIKNCFEDNEGPKTSPTPASGFAHGFFDAKSNVFSTPTQKPTARPFLDFRSPSLVQNVEITEKTFIAPRESFTVNGRFLTSTLNPNLDLFFTPTTTTTFKPATARTTAFVPTTRTTGGILPAFNTRTTNFGSSSRSAVFAFGKSFPSDKVITQSVPVSQTSTTAPVFIINGVKWY